MIGVDGRWWMMIDANDTVWCWFELIDADWFWLMLIDADWCSNKVDQVFFCRSAPLEFLRSFLTYRYLRQ